MVDKHDRNDEEAVWLWRVALSDSITGAVDTIPKLWTVDEPAVVGDSIVIGTIADTAGKRHAFFRYDLRTRHLDSLPMPATFRDSFSDLSVSPDGRFFTWAEFDDGTARAEIHAYPSLALVDSSPLIPVAPADGALTLSHWESATEARIHIWADLAPGLPWVRFRYTVPLHRWLIDSIPNDR